MRKQVDKVNQSPDANAVFEAIHSVMHLYRSKYLAAFRTGEQDITHMETRVLDYFSHHPKSTLSDLVQHSGRDKAQMTRLIRNLRDNGYLEAEEDAADRRNIRLRLSQAGIDLQQRLKDQSAPFLQTAIEGLSSEQCGELIALLNRVQNNLER